MIPILTANQLKLADTFTIENEPISSLDLMERAVGCLLLHFLKYVDQRFHVVCGTGNNRGDGLVLARKLGEKLVHCRVSVLDFGQTYSVDFESNLHRLKTATPVQISFVKTPEQLLIDKTEILVDAIFGNGLTRMLEGDFLQTVQLINQSESLVLSIDMPSGLMAEGECDTDKFIAANKVFVLECPRASLFNPAHKVDFEMVKIGLHQGFIQSLESKEFLTEEQDVLVKKRNKHSFKNTYGHLLVVGGSKGMYGAPTLSAKAAFKTGAGLVTCLVPEKGEMLVHCHIAEAMVKTAGNEQLEGNCPDLSNYSALVVGPGMGTSLASFLFLENLLKSATCPVLLDADALNMIAESNAVSLIKSGSVLTPHPGEFKRLVGEWKNENERLSKLRTLSNKTQSVVVLKGTYTAIAEPEGKIYFNSLGSPSLATAGSGDVLSGIIGSFLAQGYSALDSALRGVYYHGKAGASFEGKPVLASEIITNIIT